MSLIIIKKQISTRMVNIIVMGVYSGVCYKSTTDPRSIDEVYYGMRRYSMDKSNTSHTQYFPTQRMVIFFRGQLMIFIRY